MQKDDPKSAIMQQIGELLDDIKLSAAEEIINSLRKAKEESKKRKEEDRLSKLEKTVGTVVGTLNQIKGTIEKIEERVTKLEETPEIKKATNLAGRFEKLDDAQTFMDFYEKSIQEG